MPKVFNIMQYCKHPITGEVLITEDRKRGQGESPCDEYLKGVKRSADQLKV